MSNGFGGEVIELSDMSDLAHLMDAMGISGAHQVVLKASITSWKKNPDAAFQALAAAKVPRASAAKGHAMLRMDLSTLVMVSDFSFLTIA